MCTNGPRKPCVLGQKHMSARRSYAACRQMPMAPEPCCCCADPSLPCPGGQDEVLSHRLHSTGGLRCLWLLQLSSLHSTPLTRQTPISRPPVRACAGQLTHLFEALACCCCCAAPDLLQPRPLSCQLLVQLGHIRRVTALHQALTNLIIPAGAQT